MQNQKLPNLVTIAVLTVITIFFWIGLEVYRVLSTKPAPSVPEEILAPLNPELDTITLDKLEERVYLEPSETGQTQIKIEIEATPAALPTDSPATESASP